VRFKLLEQTETSYYVQIGGYGVLGQWRAGVKVVTWTPEIVPRPAQAPAVVTSESMCTEPERAFEVCK